MTREWHIFGGMPPSSHRYTVIHADGRRQSGFAWIEALRYATDPGPIPAVSDAPVVKIARFVR